MMGTDEKGSRCYLCDASVPGVDDGGTVSVELPIWDPDADHRIAFTICRECAGAIGHPSTIVSAFMNARFRRDDDSPKMPFCPDAIGLRCRQDCGKYIPGHGCADRATAVAALMRVGLMPDPDAPALPGDDDEPREPVDPEVLAHEIREWWDVRPSFAGRDPVSIQGIIENHVAARREENCDSAERPDPD